MILSEKINVAGATSWVAGVVEQFLDSIDQKGCEKTPTMKQICSGFMGVILNGFVDELRVYMDVSG